MVWKSLRSFEYGCVNIESRAFRLKGYQLALYSGATDTKDVCFHREQVMTSDIV